MLLLCRLPEKPLLLLREKLCEARVGRIERLLVVTSYTLTLPDEFRSYSTEHILALPITLNLSGYRAMYSGMDLQRGQEESI